jgi:hypothetical protein
MTKKKKKSKNTEEQTSKEIKQRKCGGKKAI